MQSYFYPLITLSILLGAVFYSILSPVVVEGSSNTGLTVVKTDDQTVASPGAVLIYRIVLTNHQQNDVTVQVVDRLPEYLLPLATSPDAAADPETRSIIWDDLNIPAETEITLGLRAQIEDDAPHNHVIENQVTVMGPNIEVTATDHTRIERPESVTDVSPVAPTATTGIPTMVTLLILSTLIGSVLIGKKVFASMS